MTTISESFHGALFARVTGLWAPGYVAYVADVGPVGPSRWWWQLFAEDKVPDGKGGWRAALARVARGAAPTRKAAGQAAKDAAWGGKAPPPLKRRKRANGKGALRNPRKARKPSPRKGARTARHAR